IVFLFAFVIIVINTTAGVRDVDPNYMEMARSFGARESDLFLKVVLPAALPMIMAGIRLGMGRAVLGMVTSEMILAVVGLGAMLMTFGASFNSPSLFATILTIVLVAVGLLALIQYLDRRLMPWRMRFGHQRVLVRTVPGPVDLVGGNALKITLLAVKAFLLHEKPDLPFEHIIDLLRIMGVGLRVVPRPSGGDHQTALVAVSLLD